MPMGWATSWGTGFEAAPPKQASPPQPALSVPSEPPRRVMPRPYLKRSAIRGCQLPLVIQHLLKVRDVPVLVGGVAVKPLQRPCGHVSTPCLHPTPPGHARGLPPRLSSHLTDVVMDAPMGHHLEGMQSHLQCPGTFWSCSVQGPVREEKIQIH